MITVTSVEAQNHFGKLLDTAQREPVSITRHGRIAAFIVSPQDMEVLNAIQEARRRMSNIEAFRAIFAETDKQLTAAARELTDEDIVRLLRSRTDRQQ